MITNLGKIVTLSNLATGERALVTHVAVGSVPTPAAVTDKSMAMEWARADVQFIVSDPVNNRLVIKAVLPAALEGKIYEIGAYVSVAGGADASLLTFDEATESWPGTFTTSNTRIGSSSLSLTAPSSSTASASLTNLAMDISTGSQADDSFRFAMNVSSANCNYVDFVFKSDAGNYATARVTSPPPGYGVYSVQRSALTVAGSPDLKNVTEVTVNLDSNASGGTTVDLDGARIDSAHDSVNGAVLVARQEIVSPVTKKRGVEFEIETTLGVFT